ncbi:MAG: hypothetical protein KatS3mg002_0312 [Candidatus Woesearchaeota archaeon]|nr:MAG: hypothetical protein KatS3mg002_0312 [Candidatus Woesearchaeota archaeon]
MAFLDDFTVDYQNKMISHTSGTTVYTANQMYSALQDLFDELSQMDDPVPMSAQTPTEYTLINGWFMDEPSFQYIEGGAIKTSGWDASTYDDGIRVLTFAGTPSQAPTKGDTIAYVGGSPADTGTVLYYNAATLQCFVRMSTTAHTFSNTTTNIEVATVDTGVTLASPSVTGEQLWANIYSLGSIAAEEYTLNGAHSIGAGSVVVNETIDDQTPSSGWIYLVDDGGIIERAYEYSSWSGSTFTLVGTLNENYSGGNAVKEYGEVYVVQNGQKINGWWPYGHIDVLIRVTDWDGTEIDNAKVTCFLRRFGHLYDHFEIDLSSGGRNAVPLATTNDLNNQSTEAVVANYGNGVTYNISITFGSVSKDLNNGNGSRPYDVVIDCDQAPLSKVYEYLKYVTRNGSTVNLNGVNGEQYISANSAYNPVKQSPFGTFAGGTFFGARGVWLENYQAADAKNFQLIDSNGVQQTPPNVVSVTVTSLVSGDRVAVFRLTGVGGDIYKNQYTAHASNSSGSTSLITVEAIGSDTPMSGYVRVINPNGSEDLYQYSSWTGSTFTLTTTTSKAYTNGESIYVPIIDDIATGSEKTNQLIYSSDIPVLVRVRKKGILPFEVESTITSTGMRVAAIRTPDTIVQ